MKKNNTEWILLLALGGAVAYYGYNQGWFDKLLGKGDGSDDDSPETDVDPAVANGKIEELQAVLGVGVDGIFGKNSYTALCKMYNCYNSTASTYDVGKLPYGAVTESSAVKYIADINGGKTPYQIANGSKPASTPSTDTSSKVYIANNIVRAYLKPSYGTSETFLLWKLKGAQYVKESWYGVFYTIKGDKPVVMQGGWSYIGVNVSNGLLMFKSQNYPNYVLMIDAKYLYVK